MAPHLVGAQSTYKGIRIRSFHHTHTHTHNLYKYIHYWWWVDRIKRKWRISTQKRWVFSFVWQAASHLCLFKAGISKAHHRVSQHSQECSVADMVSWRLLAEFSPFAVINLQCQWHWALYMLRHQHVGFLNIQLTQTSPPPPPFCQPHCSANSATSVHSMWTLCSLVTHWYNPMWLTGWKHQPTNQPTVPLASYVDQASHLPTNQPTVPQASYIDQVSHLPIYI